MKCKCNKIDYFDSKINPNVYKSTFHLTLHVHVFIFEIQIQNKPQIQTQIFMYCYERKLIELENKVYIQLSLDYGVKYASKVVDNMIGLLLSLFFRSSYYTVYCIAYTYKSSRKIIE